VNYLADLNCHVKQAFIVPIIYILKTQYATSLRATTTPNLNKKHISLTEKRLKTLLCDLSYSTRKSKRIPSIFKDESTGSCICLGSLTYMSHVNKVRPIRVKMIGIAATRVNFRLLLLPNGINVGIGHTCNTMRVYHDTIITCATVDIFSSLFPYPHHNPRSHTRDFATHMTVNGPGVTSRKVRYGSRDCQGHTKKCRLRHINVKITSTDFSRLNAYTEIHK
jgi:hypothetical protein